MQLTVYDGADTIGGNKILLDQHVKALQRATLSRATNLERQMGMGAQSAGEGSTDGAHKSLSEL